MRKLLAVMDYIFIGILVLSFAIMLVTIVYTFIDLYENSFFVTPSKDSIEFFLKSFTWCSPIISCVFIIFTVFYTFQAFRINNENNFFNNYIIPKEKRINKRLTQIKSSNKKMYHFLSCNIREIMTKIVRKERGNNINNKEKLEYYFNKYIANEVKGFEHSGHFGDKCPNNCSTCSNKSTPAYRKNSFNHFKLIAFDLFCISIEYADFETDIENIYESRCLESSDTKTL